MHEESAPRVTISPFLSISPLAELVTESEFVTLTLPEADDMYSPYEEPPPPVTTTSVITTAISAHPPRISGILKLFIKSYLRYKTK